MSTLKRLYVHPYQPEELWIGEDETGAFWQFPTDPIHPNAWQQREPVARGLAPFEPAVPACIVKFYQGVVKMNKVCLVGRLATDPELKYTPSGVAVCTFRLAVKDPYRTDPERPEERATDYFSVTAWRQSGEYAANNLAKGHLVGVTGRLSVDQWTAQDGTKRRDTYVTADHLENLAKPGGGAAGDDRSSRAGGSAAENGGARDDARPAPQATRQPAAAAARTQANAQRPAPAPTDEEFIDPFADQ